MSQLVLTRGNTLNRGLMAKFFNRFAFGPSFLVLSLVLFVVLITLITLVFSTRQVTKGYVLNSLDADHQALVHSLELNEMQISQVKSLKFLEDSPKVNSMVRPNQVVFVNGDTAIASR